MLPSNFLKHLFRWYNWYEQTECSVVGVKLKGITPRPRRKERAAATHLPALDGRHVRSQHHVMVGQFRQPPRIAHVHQALRRNGRKRRRKKKGWGGGGKEVSTESNQENKSKCRTINRYCRG